MSSSSSPGEININTPVSAKLAFPMYVAMKWEANTPKGKRSEIATALVKEYLGMDLNDTDKKWLATSRAKAPENAGKKRKKVLA